MKNLTTPATIENLKINRELVIETLTSIFGVEKLKASANILKNEVGMAEKFHPTKTLLDVIIEVKNSGIFDARKSTWTAELIGSMEEKREFGLY